MAAINMRRVALGAVAGGVVWVLWSMLINRVLLAHRYTAAQEAGLLLKAPRYSFFIGYWIVTLFLVSYILAWLYASARATLGAGFGTALKIGLVGGFIAGFPSNLSSATWARFDRIFPLWWMLDLWVGAAAATVIAGWLYKEQ
jgi:hypothetical protein